MDEVRIGGQWVREIDIPDAAELAEMREERKAQERAERPGPGDRTPDLPPW